MEFSAVDIKAFSGYTYIPKQVYMDKSITLQAKGLLSWMYSNDKGWTYTLEGIAATVTDGIGSVRGAIKELVEHNYLHFERMRREDGTVGESIYQLLEVPDNAPFDKDEVEFDEMDAADEKYNVRIERLPVTLMSNYHLRDKDLSLKEKGLLSIMFSLPPSWHYTEKGLAALSKNQKDSVSGTIRKLEGKKYLFRKQTRNEQGRMSKSIYTFYRIPYDIDRSTLQPECNFPSTVNPIEEKPFQGKPMQEKPSLEKEQQTKTIIKKTVENKNCYKENPPLLPRYNYQEYKTTKKKIEDRIGYEDILEKNNDLIERLEDETIDFDEVNSLIISEKHLDELIGVMTELYLMAESGVVDISVFRTIEKFETMGLRDIRNIVHRVIEAKPLNRKGYIKKIIENY